jgi:predicted nucleotidyltransferase
MDRDQIISVLKRHESELKALGVEHLLVFGSTARNTRVEPPRMSMLR